MSELVERVDQMYKTLFIGNGKLSLMTRVSLLEDQLDKINKNLSRITWLLIATLVTGVGELLLKGVK